MSKGECKAFTSIHGGRGDSHVASLFHDLRSKKEINPDKLKTKYNTAYRSNFNVLIGYLYREVMNTLVTRGVFSKMEESRIDATILFKKNLYMDSLQVLRKTRKLALEQEHFLDVLQLIALEKEQILTVYPKNLKDIQAINNIESRVLRQYEEFQDIQHVSRTLQVYRAENKFVRTDEELMAVDSIVSTIRRIEPESLGSYRARATYDGIMINYFDATGQLVKARDLLTRNIDLLFENRFLASNERIFNGMRTKLTLQYILCGEDEAWMHYLKYEEESEVLITKYPSTNRKYLWFAYYQLFYSVIYSDVEEISAATEELVGKSIGAKEYVPEADLQWVHLMISFGYFFQHKFKEAYDYFRKAQEFMLVNEQVSTRFYELVLFYELEKNDLIEYVKRSYLRELRSKGKLYTLERTSLAMVDGLLGIGATRSRKELLETWNKTIGELGERSFQLEIANGLRTFDYASWVAAKLKGVSYLKEYQDTWRTTSRKLNATFD